MVANHRKVFAQARLASDATRQAPWLRAPYSAHLWFIADSHGGKDVVVLDFQLRMPDGRDLTEWPGFYPAVKEFAFFFRDIQFTRVNDAEVHLGSVQCLMALCHALALDGFTSFEFVNAKVVKRLLNRIVKGNDGLWNASERVKAWLTSREQTNDAGWRYGLPLRARPKGDGYLDVLDNAQLMKCVGLPDSAGRMKRVAVLCDAACREAGLRCRQFSSVDEEDEDEDEFRLNVGGLYRYLNALELLFIMRERMQANSLPERPFESASATATRLGKKTKPTPIPPAACALHLISHAMLWVANYSGPLISLWTTASQLSGKTRESRPSRECAFADMVDTMPKQGPAGCPWPLLALPVKGTEDQLSCQGAIRLLFTACFVVLATFSARRRDELLDFEVDDIRGDDENGWKINSYIEKTMRAKSWIPVPPIVARAFDVLTTLSESARAETGDPSLFQWLSPFTSTPGVMTSVMESIAAIDEFARWVETPPWTAPNGTATRWHFTPHQFRKFFSVLYFYRYRGATIESLAHFLRHFNIEMTRKYLMLDPDNKRIFDEVEWGYMKAISRGIVESGGAALGGMAKRLAKQWIDRLRNVVKVTSQIMEDSETYIARQMRRQKLVVTPKAWVDCTCPQTAKAAKSASCRADSSRGADVLGPDFSRAGPCVCIDCPYSVDNGRLLESAAEEALEAERFVFSTLGADAVFSDVLLERVVTVHRYRSASSSLETEHA